MKILGLNLNSKQKTLALILLVVIGAYALTQTTLFSESVLSVSRVYLQERGAGAAGEELRGGVWRVLATSKDSTEVKFLSLNETSMQNKAVYNGDFPSDIDVTGNIYVQVTQEDKPYWQIPIVKVEDITVAPGTSGTFLDGSTIRSIDGVITQPVVASVWKLDLTRKQVFIPFRVIVAKTLGENTGFFTTDYAKAERLTSLPYQPYKIIISQSEITNGEQTAVITFTNPKDSSETVKVNLIWSFADYDQYSYDQPLIFITGANAGPIEAYNTFSGYDENAIKQQLNWQSGSDWTFYKYWFGGGNLFQGTCQGQGLLNVGTYTGRFQIDSTGATLGAVKSGNQDIYRLIAEGYVSQTGTTNNYYEYPGWYAPFPENGEGQSTNDRPQDKRFPVQPQLYGDANTKPVGLAVVNYLTSNIKTPITNAVHTPFSKVNPDIWGQGKAGQCGVSANYQVYMPTSARNWLFTLDISTEACDTVVIQQSYIDATVLSFNVDKQVLQVDETATISAVVRNNAAFGGSVSIGIVSPSNLQLVASTTGGDGSTYFTAGETKTITMAIKNTGTTNTDTSGTFTFKVTNTQGRVTASRDFSLTFKAGLSIADTQIPVKVLDALTTQPIGGLTIKIDYGDRTMQASSGDAAETILNLGKYTGSAKISVYDVSQQYLSQSQTIGQVNPGVNPTVEFRIVKGNGGEGFDYILLLAIGAVVIVIALFVMMRKRLKGSR